MLTLKQLQDAANCQGDYECANCALFDGTGVESCVRGAAEAALACIEMLIRIQHSSSDEADNACCPICGMTDDKHAKGCELAALIKEE
jgi:hypothetical protein